MYKWRRVKSDARRPYRSGALQRTTRCEVTLRQQLRSEGLSEGTVDNTRLLLRAHSSASHNAPYQPLPPLLRLRLCSLNAAGCAPPHLGLDGQLEWLRQGCSRPRLPDELQRLHQ